MPRLVQVPSAVLTRREQLGMRSAGKAKNKRGKAAGKKLMRSKSRLQKLKKANKSSHSTELPMSGADDDAKPADDDFN